MTTVYISPTGAGNKSGSSIENAASISSLNSMVKKAGAGGEVRLIADKGDYKMSGPLMIYGSGKDGAPVTIKGVSSSGEDMNAHFTGTRPAEYKPGNPSGNELFKLIGASNLTFANMTIDNTGTAFRAGSDLSNLKIENVQANNVARFFEDYASGDAKTATVSGLTLKDIEVNGFSKGVIRLQYDTHDVVIENVHGDSMRQDGDNFAMGIHLGGTVHDVLIDKTVMENATDTVGGRYWNGDGFATEKNVYNVTFRDTVARGNTDGGYDLKSSNTTLIRTVAEDNARNYRIWGDATLIDVVALNPHLRGGSSSQVQVWVAEGAKVTMKGGLLADSGTNTRVFESYGSVSVDGTDIRYAPGSYLKAGSKPVDLAEAELSKIAATGKWSLDSFADALSHWTSQLIKQDKVAAPAPTPEPAPAPEPVSPPQPAPVAEPAPAPKPAPVAEAPTAVVAPAPVEKAAPPAVVEKAAPAPAPAVDPKGTAASIILSTGKSETLKGTADADLFYYNTPEKQGADKIKGFGSNDLLVTYAALADGNGDGYIGFGKNGVLNLTDKAGTIKLPDLKYGLRYLGSDEDGYYYGDTWTRVSKSKEGQLFADDTLSGDVGDKAKTKFFVDTALNQDIGDDVILNFGKKDILVTTSALADVDKGGTIAATDGKFALHDDLGSLELHALSGAAINTLEYDGSATMHGVTYFVYSMVGSAVGTGDLA